MGGEGKVDGGIKVSGDEDAEWWEDKVGEGCRLSRGREG